MGYDVHIVKTEHWLDAASNPITKDETDRSLTAFKDLRWSQTDYLEAMNSNGESVRYYAILWQDSPAFYWIENEIKCSNPSEEQIVKMVELARSLGARVVGDDGEEYVTKKGFLGKKKLIVKQP